MFSTIEEPLDLRTIKFTYLESRHLDEWTNLAHESFDVIVAFPEFGSSISRIPFRFEPTTDGSYLKEISRLVENFSRLISRTGTLYIYGLPQWLPYFSVCLDECGWQFKYWLALETCHPTPSASPMIPTHEGILLYVRNKSKFSLRKVRSKHQKCDVCGDFTADWGGKSHLRHPMGYAISDVWDDLPLVHDKDHVLSKEVWQRLVLMTAQEHSRVLCVGYDGVQDLEHFVFE
jgi:hypothetical protein